MFNPAFTFQARLQRSIAPTSVIVSLVAPLGGWNARDPVSAMDSNDAIVLDNFIPDLSGVRQRHGYDAHASGVTGNFVESLMEYNGPSVTARMFAAGPANIFDVTASGAAGAAVVTGLTNGRWQHLMFANAGGNYLVCANGADAVRNYDGTSWSTPTITGVSSSTLIHVASHLSRLWFVQSGTLKIWYLATEAIAGAASAIDFAAKCKLGGHLVAMASWTRDGGSGMDDAAVFVTSQGELLIYSGTDPDSASTWALVGVFKGPPPIGRRCFIKFGGDLCYLSTQGILPLPQFLSSNSAGVASLALTSKISGAFRDANISAGSNFGWEMIEYPKRNLLIINVPVKQRSKQYQYVMNVSSGAWCRFTGLNAGCWALRGDDLFWGGNDGTVNLYGDTGVYDDAGSPVNCIAVQAFNNFGSPNAKRFLMARPLLAGPTDYIPQVALLTDYNISLPTFAPISYAVTGPYWDEVLWDSADWGAGLAINNLWQTIQGVGSVGAIALASKVTTPLVYNAIDVLLEPGGML